MNPRKSRYYTYIRPVIRNKLVRTYSSLVFSLITIAIFSYYAIRPTVTTILSLQKSIEEQNQIVNSLKDKVSSLVAGKSNRENIPQETRDKLEGLIPDNPALAQLMNSLSYVAEQADASVSGIQVQPLNLESKSSQINKKAETKEVEFTMSVTGDFRKLMQVLTGIRRVDRLINISTINFLQPEDQEESDLVMTVVGKAYFLKN